VSPFSVIVVLVLGVLFFGKNLPVVAKQIGSALIEFRKGLDEWKEVRHRPSGVGGSKMAVQDEPEEHFESFFGAKFEPPSDSGEEYRGG
jgi:Sec-independent protein translocase protein TatA